MRDGRSKRLFAPHRGLRGVEDVATEQSECRRARQSRGQRPLRYCGVRTSCACFKTHRGCGSIWNAPLRCGGAASVIMLVFQPINAALAATPYHLLRRSLPSRRSLKNAYIVRDVCGETHFIKVLRSGSECLPQASKEGEGLLQKSLSLFLCPSLTSPQAPMSVRICSIRAATSVFSG